MKTNIYLTLALALLSQTLIAQNANVKFGRHGTCNSGRGICAIESTVGKQAGNARFVKQEGEIVLQILMQQLTQDENELLRQTLAHSPDGYLKIELGFELSESIKSILSEMGSSMSHLRERNYMIETYGDKLIIHLAKL